MIRLLRRTWKVGIILRCPWRLVRAVERDFPSRAKVGEVVGSEV